VVVSTFRHRWEFFRQHLFHFRTRIDFQIMVRPPPPVWRAPRGAFLIENTHFYKSDQKCTKRYYIWSIFDIFKKSDFRLLLLPLYFFDIKNDRFLIKKSDVFLNDFWDPKTCLFWHRKARFMNLMKRDDPER